MATFAAAGSLASAMLAVQLSRGVWIGIVLLIFIAVLTAAFVGIWWYMVHRNHQADPAEKVPRRRAADAFQDADPNEEPPTSTDNSDARRERTDPPR